MLHKAPKTRKCGTVDLSSSTEGLLNGNSDQPWTSLLRLHSKFPCAAVMKSQNDCRDCGHHRRRGVASIYFVLLVDALPSAKWCRRSWNDPTFGKEGERLDQLIGANRMVVNPPGPNCSCRAGNAPDRFDEGRNKKPRQGPLHRLVVLEPAKRHNSAHLLHRGQFGSHN